MPLVAAAGSGAAVTSPAGVSEAVYAYACLTGSISERISSSNHSPSIDPEGFRESDNRQRPLTVIEGAGAEGAARLEQPLGVQAQPLDVQEIVTEVLAEALADVHEWADVGHGCWVVAGAVVCLCACMCNNPRVRRLLKFVGLLGYCPPVSSTRSLQTCRGPNRAHKGPAALGMQTNR